MRKEIKRLKKEISLRDRIIAERGPAAKPGQKAANPLKILQGQRKQGVATAQRKAWARHEYLRDRYELHLQAGLGKPEARKSANDDLMSEYGASEGYTEEALQDILS